MRDCLNDISNKNCLLTLAQINQELRQCLPIKLKSMTPQQYVVSCKIDNATPSSSKQPPKRVYYANWFMHIAVVNHTTLDKCGYNIWIARSQGRAKMGESISTSMWSAREKCQCSTGNFTHQWTRRMDGCQRNFYPLEKNH